MALPDNYNYFTREQWANFHGRNQLNTVTADELSSIAALNDRISLNDVQEIYVPLRHLLHIYIRRYQQLMNDKADFMGQSTHKTPFLIGISGSVAVGKTTTARLLQLLLSRSFTNHKVQLITTDGFLYPNAELEQRGILDRKGFPESYDMEHLLTFLDEVKSGRPNIEVPRYSHQIYDIVPQGYDVIDQPNILIVEGINVLQLPSNQQLYVSDYFDFSIYVDADPVQVENWYIERFETLLDMAANDPTNHYYHYAVGDRAIALADAHQIWRDVDLKNLDEFILPTRNRADLILHKTAHHVIDTVGLRKY
ncbi:type I pantothenate kinase [Lapidilactobacillus bayanensis]|uniref:type I pantothenate kinase n=1 Tax=Lapidilactobacillus bayanensis TaxID=2485998 RepID=UPI000F7B0088|nr:type I pantothenate kinase [Lapidilactobacillus bayanensis]